jgi:hypothetical protein
MVILVAVGFENLIARALPVLFDHHAVLESRAAAALHERAQTVARLLFVDR